MANAYHQFKRNRRCVERRQPMAQVLARPKVSKSNCLIYVIKYFLYFTFRLHIKEREALIKASFQRSGVNGLKKVKQLSPFEERVVALLAPAAISGADVPELFILPQEQADMVRNFTTDLAFSNGLFCGFFTNSENDSYPQSAVATYRNSCG